MRLQSEVEQLVDNKITEHWELKEHELTKLVHLEQVNVETNLSRLYTMWGNHIGAQHTLLNSFLVAHAFIFVSVVILFIEIPTNTNSLPLNISAVSSLTITLCLLGIFLAYQMFSAWKRSIGRNKLIFKYIEALESDKKFPYALKFFEN